MLNSLKQLWFEKITLNNYIKNAEFFGEMLSYAHLGEPVDFQSVKEKIEKYNVLLLSKGLRPYTLQELNESGWSGQSLSKNLPAISPEDVKKFLNLWYEDQDEVKRILSLNLFSKIL